MGPMSTTQTQIEDRDPTPAELIAARPHLAMHAMDGLLFDGVPLASIADALGTPVWVYSADAMGARYQAMASAFAGLDAHIHYAVKANDHLAVLRVFTALGAGADVVSGGELRRAREAGCPPDRIVFSGAGKTLAELDLALATGVGQINVESGEELAMLAARAAATGRVATVGLRVNPNIEAGTHEKISTGRARDKFGIPYRDAALLYAHAARLPGIRPVGLAVHIGSQIATIAPYRAAYARLATLVGALRASGLVVESVDCGGGLGIGYRNQPMPAPEALAGAVRAELGGLSLRLALEPGRWLVAAAGVLLASVVLEKTSGGTRFVVLDAAMNDLLRPAIYDAWHGIVPLAAADAQAPVGAADIVGPVCESGDTFARGRLLPALARDARVAILDAGAYGAAMSSTYNARPLAAVAMVSDGRWAVIRPRQPIEALWAEERIPHWLS